MVVGGRELIDTLWNVNVETSALPSRMELELIDTLWNVNAFLTNSHALFIRINRYIMECKYLLDKESFNLSPN